MGLGRRIIQLRKENGYTREKLAEILGISPYTLRNYELEVTDAGHPFLIKVSDLFNVSIDYLMGVTEEREKMTSHSLKSSEYDMVEKYRFISTHSPDGAVVVDTVLDREHAIAEKLKKKTERIIDLEERLVPKRIFSYHGKIAAAGTSYGFDDITSGTIEVPLNKANERADYTIGVNGDSMEPTYYDGDIVYVQKATHLDVGDVGIFQKDNCIYIKEVGENGLLSHNENYKPMTNGGDVICLGKVLGRVEE